MLVQQNPNFLSSALSSPALSSFSPDETQGGGADYLQVGALKARERSSSIGTPTQQEDVSFGVYSVKGISC